MRYANAKTSHKGIGVEPQMAARLILIKGPDGAEILIHDHGQLREFLKLLKAAAEISQLGKPRE